VLGRLDEPGGGDAGPQPRKVVDVELDRALPSIAPAPPGAGYRWARALVRLHGRPLGVVELPVGAAGLSADACAGRIWLELRREIGVHLAEDGLPVPARLTARGLGFPGARPACLAHRSALRATAPSTSIVIATRDRPQTLARCLRSLRRIDHPNFEVIVVDNAPATDATRDMVVRDHPEVHYLREARPGIAAAHNRGFRAASGSLVAFTDDDVSVDELWLLALAAGFTGDAGVACVTGLIVPAELETPAQVWADRHWGLGKGFRDELFRRPLRRLSASPYPYTAGAFGSGANMAFRASALRELGGFDPLIGAGTPACGGDDLAAFFGIIAAGHAIRYTPAALVRHWYARDVDGLRRQALGYGAGLSAYLAKVLADDPARALDLAVRAPAALAHARTLSRRRGAGTGGPSELLRLERRGMVRGVTGYLRGRRQVAAGARR
jgi:glycosyltransferase involved in cell wall biosynthesis